MRERGSEARWSHVLWQSHGVPIEVFLDWPRRKKLVYIASQSLAAEESAKQAREERAKYGSLIRKNKRRR
jgi:hypothetical protein